MAATKLIENKFLHYKTEAAFKADLKYISDESIVFVVEGRFIYSHGNYYYCNIREDQVETLAATLSDLMKDVELSESTIAAALCELSNRIDIVDQKPITKKDVGLSEVDNTSDLDKPISTATQAALNKKADKSEVVTKTWVEEQGYLTEHQDISGKVDKTTTVNGHALDSNITITKGDIGLGNVDNTSDLNKPISTAVQIALDGKLSTSVTTMPNPNPIKIQVKEVDLIEYDGSAVKTINLTSSDNITITSSGSTITIGGGTYSEATNTRNGLMSSTDKAKLDGIESGAQVNSITGVKGNAEGSYRTGNVNITPTNIGLGNVDNTSDANKPVSTAQQTALDKKVDKTTTVNGHALSGNVTVTKADVGLGNVDNTSDLNKPISTATQTALDNITEITAGSLTNLRKELEESNEILGAAINEVKASKLGRSDLNIDSIKEEINETGSAIIASAESSINAAVQKLNEELEKADINGMKQSIDTIADVASAALGELRNRLDEQEKINSYMFNLLYSKIKELETKIK